MNEQYAKLVNLSTILYNHNTMTLSTLNHKQQELVRRLFETVHAQFPDITTDYTIRFNPENDQHIWVDITMPYEDVLEADLCDTMAQASFQIWEETGYRISLFPRSSEVEDMEFA